MTDDADPSWLDFYSYLGMNKKEYVNKVSAHQVPYLLFSIKCLLCIVDSINLKASVV